MCASWRDTYSCLDEKVIREMFELWFVAVAQDIRILARDPSTTKSEGFSLLCYPVWGSTPFLSDLGPSAYAVDPMSTPGLERTHHPHPVDSPTQQHTTTLHIPLPSQKLPVTS